MGIFVIPGISYDSNIYVFTGKVPTVIDTGTGFHSKKVITLLQQIIQPAQIKQVILTHEHYDHVGGICEILTASGENARTYAHTNTVEKLKEGKSTFAEMLGGTMPKITVDIALSGDEQLTFGDQCFEVIHTPGHSGGSLCFYSKKSKDLISGDTVFAHGGFGRYDFPGGDFSALLHSIERLTTLEITSLYPGHGPIVEKNGSEHVTQAIRSIRSLI